MTAPTVSRSTYPVPVSDLLPRARKLAADLGAVPSRNRLMAELKIGRDKARAVLAELTDTADTVPALVTEPHLHVVADTGDSNGATPYTDPVPAEMPSPVSALDTVVVAPELTTAVPAPATVPDRAGGISRWPLFLLALPAFVAVWSGWVGLGELAGFGIVHPLPGIADGFSINSAITLPIGVETYAAFALRAWLSGGHLPATARRFAKWSAIGALILGALGQVAYHLLAANGVTTAPWQITTAVACLPVAVLGMGAALAHLLHQPTDHRPDH